MEKFKGKKIAILGFGIEGQSTVKFLVGSGSLITVVDQDKREAFDARVLEKLEQEGVEFVFEAIPSLVSYDFIFRSPGFHPNIPQVIEAQKNGAEITSAIKVFFQFCPCPIIGVTGTKGKGTTSTLIYEMLKLQGFDTYLGGNIGTPPLSFLADLKPDSKVILELSSFQLIDLDKSPHIAVMLMTTSEHLDYHADVYEYIEAKRNIFRFQTEEDYAIVNRDYPASNESDIETLSKVYKVSREQEVGDGCFIKKDGICLKMDGNEREIIQTKELVLRGKHNWENAQAATIAALLAGATIKSIIAVLKSFIGLPHRIEFVKIVRGVSYYDDSFSTTPETAIAAIEAFYEPKILILGGSSKNSDFTELGKTIDSAKNIKAIIAGGLEWERIKKEISNVTLSKIQVIEGSKNMHEIVENASKTGEIGDVVLLSPACASFDMFKSYKDRGEQFKKEVQSLQ